MVYCLKKTKKIVFICLTTYGLTSYVSLRSWFKESEMDVFSKKCLLRGGTYRLQ